MEGFKLSPIESVLIQQNVYADFITQFIHKYNIRPLLSTIPSAELAAKQNDPGARFDYRVAQSVIAKFFVLPQTYLYDDNNYNHLNSNSETNDNNNSNNDNINRDTATTTINNNNAHIQDGKLLSQFLSNTMSPLALPLVNPTNTNSIVPTLSQTSSSSILTTSASVNNNKAATTSTSSAVAVATGSIVLPAETTKLKPTTAISNNMKTNANTNTMNWENELLTLQNLKQSLHISNNQIYNEFKSFLQEKMNKNELKVEGVDDNTVKINELIKEYHDKGDYYTYCVLRLLFFVTFIIVYDIYFLHIIDMHI